MLTFVTSPKLSTKKPRVWVSGLLPHTPKTPRHHLLPLPEFMPLSNVFRRVKPPSKPHDKSNDTCNFCGEKGHWANKCLNKACLQTKPCSDTTEPNRCSLGAQDILDVEIHAGTVDTTKKDEENGKQTSQAGKTFVTFFYERPVRKRVVGARNAKCCLD